MNKDDLYSYLNETTIEDFPAFYTMSYSRAGKAKTIDKVIANFSDEALKKTFVVVRDSQADDYYNAYKDVFDRGCNLLRIPEGEVSGCGSTRNWVLDHAYNNGFDVAVCFDDDITGITCLWEGLDKDGLPKSCAPTVAMWREDFDFFHQRVCQCLGKISREVFAEHPEVATGHLRKVRFSNKADNAQIKYRINKGSTPRQTNIYNVKLMGDNNIRVPEEFNIHGEDVGMAAYVLENGFSCFCIPWLAYSYVPECEGSTVRDADEEKNREVHQKEWEDLQNYEMGREYLRFSKKYDDGSYMYGDVAWQRYHKLKGTKPVVVNW